MAPENGLKYCRDCGGPRPVTEFTSDRSRKNGLSFYCKKHARRRLLQSKDARRGAPLTRHRREVEAPYGTKWCPDCGAVKPLTEFVRNASNQSGWSAYCKPCHNIRGKAAKDKVGGSRTYHLQRRYGITADEVDAMVEAQGGVCAICRRAPAAHVYHDHDTGAVRALLCFNCNGGLGKFRDDPLLLHTAAYYVTFHRTRQEIYGRRPPATTGREAGSRDPGSADPADRRPGPRRAARGRRKAAAQEERP
jgi:Recombination endonuclease VII